MVKQRSTTPTEIKDRSKKNENTNPPVKRKIKEPREDPSKSPMGTLKLILAFLIFLWACIYMYHPQLFHKVKITKSKDNPYYNDVKNTLDILDGLKKISSFDSNDGLCFDKSVLVGYNTNLDLVVDAIDLLGHISLPKTRAQVKSHNLIQSTSQLESTFSYYFESGSAAERFVDDESTFKEILDAAMSLEHKTYFTGGNAGIMANRLASEGCNVYLSGAVGNILKGLLNERIHVIPPPQEKVVEDEVHLIMEYNKQSEWYGVSPPRSNRFIISRDLTNSQLLTLDSFHNALPNLKDPIPDLILLSGLHLLTPESQEPRTLAMVERIRNVPFSNNPNEFLESSKNIPIHLELASIADANYMKMLAKLVIPNVDSIGLNEQELGFLYTTTGGSLYKLEDFKEPSINTVVEALKHVFTNIILKDLPNNEVFDENVLPERRLTSRIHFHYLTYHIIAIKSGYSQHWRSPASSLKAVAASSLEATKQACNFTNITYKTPSSFKVDYHYTPGSTIDLEFNESHPVTSWEDLGIEFFIAPVLVCNSPSKTVGLGDSISTISYLYQTIKPLK